MQTVKKYQANISAHICSNPTVLRKEFEALKHVRVALSVNELAYWTLPRSRNDWRLPIDRTNTQCNELLLLPVRNERYISNAYLAVIPQPIIMHRKIAKLLEDYAVSFFQHYPEENSLARREHGVPMLIGRFDVIVDKKGNIQICELDDVCSLWPALPKINPIAESYLRELERQISLPIYTAELFQYADGPFAASPFVRYETYQRDARDARDASYYEKLLQRVYLHNEDYWRGDINDAWLIKKERFLLEDVALSVRAYRDMPGFKEHLDRYGTRSITMAWERDSKWPLVAENLAVLAANLDIAITFRKQWEADHPNDLLVFKSLYSARTEHTAIFSNRGTKLKGVSSASQIRHKFGNDADGPIVIQPYKEPDNLAEAGIQFIGTEEENKDDKTYTDRKRIRSVNHIGSTHPGERIVAGLESHFAMIFRSFVIYLPKEKRIVHVGGMWQATDGRIVHGGAHSLAGPLYIDGLMGHMNSNRSASLVEAEAMMQKNASAKRIVCNDGFSAKNPKNGNY